MNSLRETTYSTRESLARDTIIGRGIIQGLVEAPTFSRDDLLRDTYVVTNDSFPYMVAASSLEEPAAS